MSDNVVFVTALPSNMRRRGHAWNELSYVEWCERTWAHYCRRHGARLFVWREPRFPTDEIAPTHQKYLAFDILSRAGLPCDKVAFVDADTMVRWDAPDLFREVDTELGVVADREYRWIHASTAAYQPLFPGIELPWAEYFNSGVMVASRSSHRRFFEGAFDFFATHRTEIDEIRAAHPFAGTDQTPMNFLARREGLALRFMHPTYNFQKCVPLPPKLQTDFEQGQPVDSQLEELCGHPEAFRFMEMAHVWHYNGLYPTMRHRVMAATWERARDRYADSAAPGAPPP